MRVTGKITVDMKPINQILKAKGLTADGDVQRFHTQNVLRRIQKYMPYRTGSTIKTMIAQTDTSKPEIVLDVPHGRFIYHGLAMTGSPPKTVTDRPLRYTKTKNPQAGPYWDRALKANEMPVMQRELQSYVNRKAGKK